MFSLRAIFTLAVSAALSLGGALGISPDLNQTALEAKATWAAVEALGPESGEAEIGLRTNAAARPSAQTESSAEIGLGAQGEAQTEADAGALDGFFGWTRGALGLEAGAQGSASTSD
jgi:hypothetical protein